MLQAASAIVKTVTGALPLVLSNAINHAIVSLTRYGLCTQDGTPTPSAPVDIMCNNGALKFGWYDIITTSALSGYGTYVSPSGTAGNRAYKWFKDLPNGTYTFAVDGDYEIIVQWREPADPSVIVPSSYENISGWMTSGEVVLDKESGGYGIAVRRTVGTSSITPSNFDGTFHVAEQGIYVDGTPEVLTVSGKNLFDKSLFDTESISIKYTTFSIPNGKYTMSSPDFPVGTGSATNVFIMAGEATSGASSYGNGVTSSSSRTITVTDGKYTIAYRSINSNNANNPKDFKWQLEYGDTATAYEPYVTPQTVTNLPMLLSVGDYKDEAELISGIKTGKVGIKVFDGTESFGKSSAYGAAFYFLSAASAWGAKKDIVMCSHYLGRAVASSASAEDTCFFNASGHFYFRVADNSDTEAFKADLAAKYASGTPVILLYALATETTEQTTAQHLVTNEGTNIIDSTSNVSPIDAEVEYAAKKGA